jgi:hypothetical protein
MRWLDFVLFAFEIKTALIFSQIDSSIAGLFYTILNRLRFSGTIRVIPWSGMISSMFSQRQTFD